MDHKDWGSDDFLDEFLDFHYDKPVHRPDRDHQDVKPDQKLQTEKIQETRKDNKKYGLDDDSLREYERLRHGTDGDAGKQAGEKAYGLRTSDAFKADIPEPLSAKHAPKAVSRAPQRPQTPQSPRQEASDQIRKKVSFDNTIDEPLGSADRILRGDAEIHSAPQEIPEDNKNDLFSSIADKIGSKAASIPKPKHINPSELASGAIHAAKKFVASEEDKTPEAVPAAPAAADIPERDDVSELFRELGEPVAADKVITSEEDAALRQAQVEAYDRYRHNVNKKIEKKKKAAASGRAGFIPRWLSRIYVVALAVFVAIMTFMNVLPFGMLVAFYIILGLLSVIIIGQLRKRRVNTWVRVLASLTAVLLIGFFGVGTAYAMGTLSFLDKTSVKNESRVRSITREPFNVCITGIDSYGYIDEEEGRSDVNMVVTVNPKTEQVLMTSIPRDYQIYMPDKDYAMDKLTHTGFYGVDCTIAAEENLLSTKINYFVKVNFTTVKAFIYSIGGVYVWSDYEFYPVKMPEWKVEKGWNYMGGKEALAFARERKAFPDGDNQRIKNQQAVMEAVIKKATSSKTMALSYNKILSELKDYFRMSFSSSELRALIKLQIARNPDWQLYKNTITGGDGSMPTYSTGGQYAYVMTQDEESIEHAKTLIQAVLDGKMLDKDEDGNVIVAGTENTDNQEDGETETE